MSTSKRKRISRIKETSPTTVHLVVDKEVFTKNASSDKAKKVLVFNENLNVEIWIDKHYQNRVYHGSDDGSERDGIEYVNIEPVLIKSFKHLLYYSLKHKNFVFVNHPPSRVRNNRLVLKELIEDEVFLNIVVEYHFIDLNTIEITLVTAMKSDNFNMSNGQFGIEFEDNYSKLIQFSKGKLSEIDTYEYHD
ncbi:hypothetical protein [Algibacter lectus]|uniref:hypothetical protein n=1 Tax=Algibacter lectus TaxID=221126 RepID=UPI0026EE6B40|nr:hypothetical protein [Algibacter lectus]MDO7138282.1 hypothetical protein [Algibacter lectus]